MHTSPPVSYNNNSRAGANASPFGTTAVDNHSAPISVASNLSLDQLLLNALVGDEDSDPDDDLFSTPAADVSTVLQYRTVGETADGGAFYIDRLDEMRHQLPLCEADWVVQLNTLCMVASCISALKSTYQRGSGVAAIYKPAPSYGTCKATAASGGPIEILMQV